MLKKVESKTELNSYVLLHHEYVRSKSAPDRFIKIDSGNINYEDIGELTIEQLTDLSVRLAEENKNTIFSSEDEKINNYILKQVVLLSAVKGEDKYTLIK